MSTGHDGGPRAVRKGEQNFTRVLITGHLTSPSFPASLHGAGNGVAVPSHFARASASPLLLPLTLWLSYIILGLS